ncbi:hypothetical protein PY092_12615 [Muricauda sp. 334s03]|uniref:Apea-like HEPN domain-containing protein n=1 Tax=Flagellimonas yonaguniensis TaxID=3031325 RepID=A0ABT5Y1Q1_9FLAO|nr:hypothetical protein [[Muricauda] yonaguniensis]MDF0716997.1 hypothetical protein [[Muricauda] yonaguniensis]
MELEHIIALKESDDFLEDKDVREEFHRVSINNKIALPILCSYSFDRKNEIIIEYEPTTRKGLSIGVIKFLKGSKRDYTSLPDDERICFYIDYQEEVIVDPIHTFRYDYLLIEAKYFTTYRRKYKSTSPLWGGYFHVEDKPEIKFEKKKTISKIIIRKDLKISNSVYKDNLLLSINEPNPFNRFLKLYHLLELQFDLHTAEKIKDLVEQGNKEREISTKLKEYTKEEIKRLQSIVFERCKQIDDLVLKMNIVKGFENKADTIFYEYGRQSNPLKKQHFVTILNSANLFDKESFDRIGNFRYEELITSICAYWIYRVRSSIAHNKFGEYIMDKHDEEFIVEFAEPLLKEVVTQCFKT